MQYQGQKLRVKVIRVGIGIVFITTENLSIYLSKTGFSATNAKSVVVLENCADRKDEKEPFTCELSAEQIILI